MRRALSLILMTLFLLVIVVPVWADEGDSPQLILHSLWPIFLAWLVPVGLGLVACGSAPPDRTVAVIRLGWLALAVSVLVYWLCGFAFQFGGIGFFTDHPDLVGLAREWVWLPVEAPWGGGMLGLDGFLLRGAGSTPMALSLFLAQLPWLTTTVAVVLWSLQGRAKPVVLAASAVLVAVLYSLLGNWAWGGGWLAGLGVNAGLGHGFVDVLGGGAHLLAAACASAGILAFGTRRWMRKTTDPESDVDVDESTYVPMPPLHLPLLATLGGWLAVIGWFGWALSVPALLYDTSDVSALEMCIGLLLAASGGAFVAGIYSWLTTGAGNALMIVRGVLGALIAVSSGLPFLPLWAALAVGAGAGLLVPLVQYTVEHLLRLDDPTSAVATHGVPALWGLLAVALLADGHAGQGWNRVTVRVTGFAFAGGDDWLGQLEAQAIGIVAIVLVAFFISWLLFALSQSLNRAWGTYVLRLPKRESRVVGPQGQSTMGETESSTMPKSALRERLAALLSNRAKKAPEVLDPVEPDSSTEEELTDDA